MMTRRLMPLILGAAALAGCASGPQAGGGKSTAAAGEQVFIDADAAIAARQEEKAFAMLKAAGAAHPVDKRPWLKMAQIRYNAGVNGEAISLAQEALERDPDDTIAHSIIVVSGLRAAAKSTADLTRKNNLNGDLKSEALDLTKLLRVTLGEEKLFKQGEGTKPAQLRPKPAGSAATASAAPAVKPAAKSNDPFEGLK